MFPRRSFVVLLCLVVPIALCNGKPLNSSTIPIDKPAKPQAGQSFVVNNNCGLANTEREMIAHIKTKVDFLSAQSNKGNARSIMKMLWAFYL